MKLFKSKVWSVMDIGLLKWSCILFGMVAGALLAEFTQRYLWWFVGLAILLAIKPTVTYFTTD